MDVSSRQLREAEWNYIQARRRKAEIPATQAGQELENLTGLALSGGGIRSATFALGVLQALTKHDLLRRFDYLSTVSGGGYVGSSLTWLTSRIALDAARAAGTSGADGRPALPADGFGLEPPGGGDRAAPTGRPFPYGIDDPRTANDPEQLRAEGAMLRYLRQHGNYLNRLSL
jgi:hypothetical protein